MKMKKMSLFVCLFVSLFLVSCAPVSNSDSLAGEAVRPTSDDLDVVAKYKVITDEELKTTEEDGVVLFSVNSLPYCVSGGGLAEAVEYLIVSSLGLDEKVARFAGNNTSGFVLQGPLTGIQLVSAVKLAEGNWYVCANLLNTPLVK